MFQNISLTDMNMLVSAAINEYHAVQKPEELLELLTVMKNYDVNKVLEIGSWHGGTMWLWKVLTIEAVGIDDGSGLEPWWHQVLKTKYNIIDYSYHDERAYDLAKAYAPYDMLFIDGDHSYEGVKQDYEMYSNLVKPDGQIVFHDILNAATNECNVKKLWEEIKSPASLEIRKAPLNWGGIGIL